jgi:hypothetical protein
VCEEVRIPGADERLVLERNVSACQVFSDSRLARRGVRSRAIHEHDHRGNVGPTAPVGRAVGLWSGRRPCACDTLGDSAPSTGLLMQCRTPQVAGCPTPTRSNAATTRRRRRPQDAATSTLDRRSMTMATTVDCRLDWDNNEAQWGTLRWRQSRDDVDPGRDEKA